MTVQTHYERLDRKAKDILEDFADFTEGIRALFLIYRTKEKEVFKVFGDDTNVGKHHQHLRMTIVNGKEELHSALVSYLDEAERSPLSLRVQLAVNPRNMEKGIREFKRQQLEADYYDPDHRASFYLRAKDRMVSSLMKPANRESTLFLVDCDSVDDMSSALKKLEELKVPIVKQYPSKNGWHIITHPFDRSLFSSETLAPAMVHTDGLLLLSWR